MGNLIYNEKPGIIFDYENDYVLVNYMGADFVPGDKLTRVMDTRYGVRADLIKRYGKENGWRGEGYCLPSNNNHILNLIVKYDRWGDTNLQIIKQALNSMMIVCKECDIKKVAMPRFYEYEWQKVSDFMRELYIEDDFEIRVIYMNEYLKGDIGDADLEKLNFGKDRKNIDGNLEKKYF